MMKTFQLFIILFLIILSSALQAQTNSVFQGKVLNHLNNKPLKHANIRIDPIGIETNTDSDGNFSFNNLPATNYLIKVYKPGYEMNLLEIDLKTEKTIVKIIKLIPYLSTEIEDMAGITQKQKINGDEETLNAKEIAYSSSTFIFKDAINSVKWLPGVASKGDLLSIQGGAQTENMVFMDDVMLLPPFHSQGTINSINPDFVHKIELAKAGYPAQFGNADSAIINIETKKGSFNEFQGFLDISTGESAFRS